MDWRTLHARGNRTAEWSGTTRAPTITLGGNEGDQSGKKCEIHIPFIFCGDGRGERGGSSSDNKKEKKYMCATH